MSPNVNKTTTELTHIQSGNTASTVMDTKPVNSIHTVQNKGTVEQTAPVETSKLDELLEKMCNELSNSQITSAQLKNSGILYRITGCNEYQLTQKTEDELKDIISCLKQAILDSTDKEVNINLEKVGNIANDYYVAINTGWSIKGFKKHNGNVQKSSLFERLKDPNFPKIAKLLANYNSIEEVPKETLAEAIYIFFNEVLIGKEKTDKDVKMQLQTFGRLLINTPDSEKEYFKEILPVLVAENRLPGLEAVSMSFATPEAREAWANGWTAQEIDKLLNTKDVYGNAMGEEGTSAVATIVQNQSEEVITKNHNDFLEELKAIEEKIAKGVELTSEEEEKYYNNEFYSKVFGGETVGIANSNVLVDEAIEKLLDDVNRDIYLTSIYKEVLEKISNLMKNNPALVNKSQDEIVKALDKATNGNYSIIANGEDKTLNAPVEIKTPTEAENADLGLPNAESIDTSRLTALTEQVASTQEVDTGFIIEKNITSEQRANNEQTEIREFQQRAQLFRNGDISAYKSQTGESSFSIAKDILVNIGDACQKAQDFATTYLENASFAMQKFLLNGISYSQEAMKVAAKTIDLSNFNLNLSVTTRKAVEKIQEQQVY